MATRKNFIFTAGHVDWRYHDPRNGAHSFETWLENLIRAQDAQTADDLRAFMDWVDKTWSAPTSAESGDRMLRYFRTTASIAAAKLILAELFEPYMTREIWFQHKDEIKIFWNLVWLHVRLGEDDYLEALAEAMLNAGKPSHLLHLNGYLRWRDEIDGSSDLARKIADLTNHDPVFTHDPSWLAAVETGIPAINKTMNRLYWFSVRMRLEDREQQGLVWGQGGIKLPAIRAAFSYPVDRNKSFQWSVELEQLYPDELELGIRFQQGQHNEEAFFWPPVERHKPRELSEKELALRATRWPRLDAPRQIPSLVRQLISTFDLNIDMMNPMGGGKRDRKLLGSWLANYGR